jgi:hypothetical protein
MKRIKISRIHSKALNTLCLELAVHRRKFGRLSHPPAQIWVGAVALCNFIPLSFVATRLGLSGNSLRIKGRAFSKQQSLLPIARSTSHSFFEVKAAGVGMPDLTSERVNLSVATSSCRELQLEVRRNDGVTFRIQGGSTLSSAMVCEFMHCFLVSEK